MSKKEILITNLKLPKDLCLLNENQLIDLSLQVREIIISLAKDHSIHFSSNLGIVELTISLLRNFNPLKDDLFFDTGHQTYPYKILTDRLNEINSIRLKGGLNGLMNHHESPYDKYSPGHAGNILSIASGFYNAKKLLKKDNFQVAIIGDSGFANGMALEALNDIGFYNEPIIIIVNDNNMSIRKTKTGLNKFWSSLKVIDSFAEIDFKHNSSFFNSFNVMNVGPINGHNIKLLDECLIYAKDFVLKNKKPFLLHVKTIKGKGYEKVENDPSGNFHAYHFNKNAENDLSLGTRITLYLSILMGKDNKIVALNPAMASSSGCEILIEKFPERFFDLDIAEEHALTKAAGLAICGFKVVFYIYSTFLARAVDVLLHDFFRFNLNLVLLIDRCELIQGDGASHYGIYDLIYLNKLNNSLVVEGRNIEQYEQLLQLGINYQGIFAIRYPKDQVKGKLISKKVFTSLLEWEMFDEFKSKVLIISHGPIINSLWFNICSIFNVDLSNSIVINKLNEVQFKDLCKRYKTIILYEKIYFSTGLENVIEKFLVEHKININFIPLAYFDPNIAKDLDEVERLNKMDFNYLIKMIKKWN